jgi:hypothetical protein
MITTAANTGCASGGLRANLEFFASINFEIDENQVKKRGKSVVPNHGTTENGHTQ